jgi:hypothetical protein
LRKERSAAGKTACRASFSPQPRFCFTSATGRDSIQPAM